MGKYLRNGQSLVYLDQCVLSRFLPRAANAAWREVCELLRRGVRTGRVICPSSLEHLVETAALPDTEALALGEILEELSGGWALRLEPELAAKQIIDHLRGTAWTQESFLAQGLFHPLTGGKPLSQLRALRSKTDVHNEWLMRGVNQMNSWTRGGNRGKDLIWPWMRTRRRETILSALTAAIAGTLKTGIVRIESDRYAAALARWETVITHNLITRHCMAAPEAFQLLRLFREQGLDLCPLLALKADLSALQFANREKIEPRDQYDITRAACAFPYADVFITDGGKAAALRELKLDQRYQTEVFSTKPKDLAGFQLRLEALLSK